MYFLYPIRSGVPREWWVIVSATTTLSSPIKHELIVICIKSTSRFFSSYRRGPYLGTINYLGKETEFWSEIWCAGSLDTLEWRVRECPCLANFAGRTSDDCRDEDFPFPASLHKKSVANSYIDGKQSSYWKAGLLLNHVELSCSCSICLLSNE